MSTDDDRYLLVSRGLYWRPDSRGYTGIRDEAGRYSHDRALKHENLGGGVYYHEDDAPEVMSATCPDLKLQYYMAKSERLEGKVKFAKSCLEAIAKFDDGTENIGKSKTCGVLNIVAQTYLETLDHV